MRMRILAALLACLCTCTSPTAAVGTKQSRTRQLGIFVLNADSSRAVCGGTVDDRLIACVNRTGQILNPITEIPTNPSAENPLGSSPARSPLGLKITLRTTTQLDQNPQAKAAFQRAAETWEQMIQATPISIVIDVDFGPKSFGNAFPDRVLGITDTQLLFLSSNYAYIRSHLVSEASSVDERTLYDTMPVSTVSTDLGNTRNLYAPSAALRALHFLDPEAKPSADVDRIGPPPAIAVNSAYAFDFDPSDGIDADKRDFFAVVLHEMGHVLGFTSAVGLQELNASFPTSLSVLDLFRVKPGTTTETFGSTRRILQSGGDQVFFDGIGELPLSTGRPDASGGDGRQASHWKDEALTGTFIGLMHPALKTGVAESLTASDLRAFEAIGYTLKVSSSTAVANISADLIQNTLTVDGDILDRDLAIGRAEITLLNRENLPVAFPVPVSFSPIGTDRFSFVIPTMDRYPDAGRLRLEVFDPNGMSFGLSLADFSAADPSGPSIKRAKYAKNQLTLVGDAFAADSAIEINGTLVTDIHPSTNAKRTKLKFPASRSDLNLRAGSNRLRLITQTGRSNVTVLMLD